MLVTANAAPTHQHPRGQATTRRLPNMESDYVLGLNNRRTNSTTPNLFSSYEYLSSC